MKRLLMKRYLILALVLLAADVALAQHGMIAGRRRAAATGSGLTIAAVTTALNTTTGNQTFSTTDMGGATPDGALIFISGASANATTTDHVVLGLGMTDCDNADELGYTTNVEDGQPTSDAASGVRGSANNDIIELFETPGELTSTGRADFVSCQADGITIDWPTNAPSTAYLATVVLFDGFDNWACDAAPTSGTVDTGVDINLGWQADGLIMVVQPVIAMNGNSTNSSGGLSFGAWDGTNQAMVKWFSRNNVATTETTGKFSTNRAGQHGNQNQRAGYEISSHASGFTVTTRDSNSDGADDPYFCAFELPTGAEIHVGTGQSPTTTGIQNVTAPGFTPQAALFGFSLVTSLNTYTDTESHGMSIGVAAQTVESGLIWSDQDAVTTSQSASRIESASALYLLTPDASAAEAVADVDAWTATGFDLDWTSVDATNQYQFFYIAFKTKE